jgi:hypothetical protein
MTVEILNFWAFERYEGTQIAHVELSAPRRKAKYDSCKIGVKRVEKKDIERTPKN